MRKAIAMIALLGASQIHADDGVLVLHLASLHGEPGYNGSNPGLGLRIPRKSYYLGVGVYRNSLERATVYAGIGKHLVTLGPVELRLAGGLVTGYARDVAPFVLPELAIAAGEASVVLSYIPAVEFGKDLKTMSAIGLSLELPLR
jgi:hypothetical protein